MTIHRRSRAPRSLLVVGAIVVLAIHGIVLRLITPRVGIRGVVLGSVLVLAVMMVLHKRRGRD